MCVVGRQFNERIGSYMAQVIEKIHNLKKESAEDHSVREDSCLHENSLCSYCCMSKCVMVAQVILS